jgi:hypothetical protein
MLCLMIPRFVRLLHVTVENAYFSGTFERFSPMVRALLSRL